jgi:hypothetical protein
MRFEQFCITGLHPGYELNLIAVGGCPYKFSLFLPNIGQKDYYRLNISYLEEELKVPEIFDPH